MDKDYLYNSIQTNDKYQKKYKKDKYIDPIILKVIEQFISDNKRICYGGTAINNILPKNKQFYDYDIDIPDYDFFSPNAIDDTKKLCNILSYYNIYHIEAKSAFFVGTYKIFVNFIPIADITQINTDFYNSLLKNSILVNQILYTNTDFLRMSLHQELARPLGDISRWEKIYKRLFILNDFYPIILKSNYKNNCKFISGIKDKHFFNIYNQLFSIFIDNEVIFCNHNIISNVFYKHLKTKNKKKFYCSNNKKDLFLCYTNDITQLINTIKLNNIIKESNYISFQFHESKYKFIGNFVFIHFKKKIIGIIFETNSCLSYNSVLYFKKNIKIGNIDMLLNLYFSLLLMDEIPISNNILYKQISILYNIISNYESLINTHNGVDNLPNELKRFNLPCIGTQDDYQNILQQRTRKYKKLKNNKTSSEYKKWFFKYTPIIKKANKKTSKSLFNNKKSKSIKNKTNKNIKKL